MPNPVMSLVAIEPILPRGSAAGRLGGYVRSVGRGPEPTPDDETGRGSLLAPVMAGHS